MTEIPELNESDFERAMPARLRRRFIKGGFRSGEDIAALRRFTGLTQELFAKAMGIRVHTCWRQPRRAARGWRQSRQKPQPIQRCQQGRVLQRLQHVRHCGKPQLSLIPVEAGWSASGLSTSRRLATEPIVRKYVEKRRKLHDSNVENVSRARIRRWVASLLNE